MNDKQKELERFLKNKGVWYRLLDKPSTIHTADASNVTGISLNRITKSLVFKADAQPIMAVIPGDKRVNSQKLAEAVKAKKISLVPFKEADQFSGYPPGGTPPIHHSFITKIVFDKTLLQYDTVFGGGGSQDKLIELKVKDMLKHATDRIVAEISE
jgi:Cys-tRNA(Pro)/Cys-tRNA(Cys) deacylase